MLKDSHREEGSTCLQNWIYNLFNDTEFRYSHSLLFKCFLLAGFDVTLLGVLDVMRDSPTYHSLPRLCSNWGIKTGLIISLWGCQQLWSLNFCDVTILIYPFKILEHESLAQDRRNSHEPSVQIRISPYLISLKTWFLEGCSKLWKSRILDLWFWKNLYLPGWENGCAVLRVISNHYLKLGNL